MYLWGPPEVLEKLEASQFASAAQVIASNGRPEIRKGLPCTGPCYPGHGVLSPQAPSEPSKKSVTDLKNTNKSLSNTTPKHLKVAVGAT